MAIYNIDLKGQERERTVLCRDGYILRFLPVCKRRIWHVMPIIQRCHCVPSMNTSMGKVYQVEEQED